MKNLKFFTFIYSAVLFIIAWLCMILRIWFSIELSNLFSIIFIVFIVVHANFLIFLNNKKNNIMSVVMLIPILLFLSEKIIFSTIAAIIYLITFILLKDKKIKLFGLLQYIIIIPCIFLLYTILNTSYESKIVKKEIVSPNNKYIVKIQEYRGGLHDKDLSVDFYPNYGVNLGFIKLKPHRTNFTTESPGTKIYVYWKNNLEVDINGETYSVKTGKIPKM